MDNPHIPQPGEPGHYELTELQYAVPTKGDKFKLYVFGPDGFHDGAQWFTSGQIAWPNEEITAKEAERIATAAIDHYREVRVTDAGDMLIAHWKGGERLYPKGNTPIWELL